MELMENLGSMIIGIAVLSAVMQVVFAYSLQVIANKNELSDSAAFMAWLPVLNIYPMIKVGGFDFKRFLIGCAAMVGLMIGAGMAGAILGEQMGGLVFMGVMALVGLVSIVYFAKLMMATADRRGLASWLGLLNFVPLLNFVIYPYIAFHDGFEAPNKLGLALGLLLAFGPVGGQIKMAQMMQENAMDFAAQVEEAQNEAGLEGMPEGMDDMAGLGLQLGGADGAMQALTATMEAGAQLAVLDGLDPSDPGQAEQMRQSLGEVRRKLSQAQGAMDPETAAELRGMLQAQETRLAAATGTDPGTLGDDEALANAIRQAAAVPADPVADRTGSGRPMPPEPQVADSGGGASGGFAVGLPVPDMSTCPADTVPQGAEPPEGTELWCERADDGMRHGWYREWFPDGQIAVAGEYAEGLRVGVWTRWFPNGVMRVQAEFDDGMQDGMMIAWSDEGVLVYEASFSSGAPASIEP